MEKNKDPIFYIAVNHIGWGKEQKGNIARIRATMVKSYISLAFFWFTIKADDENRVMRDEKIDLGELEKAIAIANQVRYLIAYGCTYDEAIEVAGREIFNKRK